MTGEIFHFVTCVVCELCKPPTRYMLSYISFVLKIMTMLMLDGGVLDKVKD